MKSFFLFCSNSHWLWKSSGTKIRFILFSQPKKKILLATKINFLVYCLGTLICLVYYTENVVLRDWKKCSFLESDSSAIDWSLSRVWLVGTPQTAARQASLSYTVSQILLKLASIELMMPSNHLILCHPLLHLLSIFLNMTVFSSKSVLPIRWPKYWSFSFSTSLSNEYSGLIAFRID